MSLALAGCGGLNQVLADRTETTELYHVFDIKTTADIDTVINSAADGLAQNSNSIRQNRPLMMGATTPATPGRFQLVDMASAFQGTGMGTQDIGPESDAGIAVCTCHGLFPRWTLKAAEPT